MTDSILNARKLILVLALGAAQLAAPAAFAQDEKPDAATLEEARSSFMEGKKLFDAGELRKAALAFKKSYKLSKNPILLYNIGFTIDKMGKVDLAIFYYDKFLADAPENAPNRDLAEKRLAELKKEKQAAEQAAASEAAAEKAAAAKAEAEAKAKATRAAAGADAGGGKLQHNIVEEAPPGKPLDITAFVPEESEWQVAVYYRLPGVSEYTKVPTIRRYAELVGRIPATATANVSSVQYYVEARSGTEIVGRSGEPTSPHLITIDASAQPRFYPDLQTSGVAPTGTPLVTGQPQETDTRSKYFWPKWGSTGAAGTMVLATVAFYALAADRSSTLEGEAQASTVTDTCFDKPCRTYAKRLSDLQSSGERYELLGHISLGLGAAAIATAGVFWYLDLKGGKEGSGADHYNPDTDSPISSISVSPVVGGSFMGGAARIEF